MKRIGLCLVILLTVNFAKAQDRIFLNPNQSLIHLNPSFAGSNGLVRVQGSYQEYVNYNVTTFASVDAYLKKLKGGISLSHLHDDYSRRTLKTDYLSLSYAQHFSLLDNKLKIIPSLTASYLQRILDRSRLVFGGQYSGWPVYGATQTKRNFDFSSGVLISYKNLYAGASVFHITRPNEGLWGDSRLPARFSFHASYNWHFSEKAILHFFANYQSSQVSTSIQASLNALLFKHLIIGVGYLHRDLVSATIGFRHNYFTLLASYGKYEYKISSAHQTAGNLSASFNLRNKENRKTLTDFEKW